MIKINIPDNVKDIETSSGGEFTQVPKGVYTVEAISAVHKDEATKYPIPQAIKTTNKDNKQYRKPGLQVAFKFHDTSGNYDIHTTVHDIREAYQIVHAFGGDATQLTPVPATDIEKQEYLGLVLKLANNGTKNPTISVNDGGFGDFWTLSGTRIGNSFYYAIPVAINKVSSDFLKPIEPKKDRHDKLVFDLSFVIVADVTGEICEYSGCLVTIPFIPYALDVTDEGLDLAKTQTGDYSADGKRMGIILEYLFPDLLNGKYIVDSPDKLLHHFNSYIKENPIPVLCPFSTDSKRKYQKLDILGMQQVKDNLKDKINYCMDVVLGKKSIKSKIDTVKIKHTPVKEEVKTTDNLEWHLKIFKDYLADLFNYGFGVPSFLEKYPILTKEEGLCMRKLVDQQLKLAMGIEGTFKISELTPEQVLLFMENVDLTSVKKDADLDLKVASHYNELKDSLIQASDEVAF